MKKRWWSRFGITAPQVAVRAHVPWYWRLIGTTLMLAIAVALGAWTYDTLRQATGGEQAGAQQIQALRGRIDELQGELAAQRSAPPPSESAQQIERTTYEQLVRQVKALEEQNARLKEELALFERLQTIGGGTPGLTINGLQVEADTVPGQYRYRALVAAPGGKNEGESRASMQLVVSLMQGEQHAMMVLPGAKDADRQRYNLTIRYFRRIDGTFQLPTGSKVVSVELRLLQDGALRASQRVTF
jgi:hypothetical protein